ncbi:MAG: CCA tRNA nucleotidyltransferase [Fuerstiella sp.]|mgnify:CR=1 FL=1
MNSPDNQNRNLPRVFALNVVETLRGAGFSALWAGGCVRDDLLGIPPKDYDVATNATPDQVIELFGKRKTVPVGVSFGVVMVLGPTRAHGQVEVATFRADGEYLDGRRPSAVSFCSAEEDAKRRDFTINGMFFDPVTLNVIDYVGGRTDLANNVLRAIGDANARFTEDKLRMLRAVRFAATYEFSIEPSTASAIKQLSHQITQVSAERIAQELRRMLAHSTRAISVRNLYETGLAEVLFPKLFPSSSNRQQFDDTLQQVCDSLNHLKLPAFESSFAVLMYSLFDEHAANSRDRVADILAECHILKLSNEETDCICWLADSALVCRNANRLPLHIIKPLLHDSRSPLLLDLLAAQAFSRLQSPEDAVFLTRYLEHTTTDALNPPPFVDGADLKQLGIQPGPIFKQLLTTIRNEQLDEILLTREQAIERLRQLNSS